jgi:hypothetical protein
VSRGLGWVQQACLRAIDEHESLMTYDIAAEVYEIKPDKDGWRWVNAAQHVAVKRALEGLQRQGRIIGFRTHRFCAPNDDRIELSHHWMTEKGLAKWLSAERRFMNGVKALGGDTSSSAERMIRVLRKAEAIGMKLEPRESK